MTRARGPEELLRELANESPPSLPGDDAAERRDRIVHGMKVVIQASGERAEKRQRWRRGLLIFAAAASVLLLSSVLLRERFGAAQRATLGDVESVVGTVVLTQDGVRRVLSTDAQSLRNGDALQTAAAARAHVATGKASVKLAESTEIKLSVPSSAEERISLRRGRVDVSVDKHLQPQRSVVVETPDAEVVVRGTVFDVRVEPSGGKTATHVHVTRGSVWVLAQGAQVALLTNGQSWSSNAPAAAEAKPSAVTRSDSAIAPSDEPLAAPHDAEPPGRAAPPDRPASSPDRPASSPDRAAPSPDRAAPSPARASSSPPKDGGPSRKQGTLAAENRLFASAIEARNRGDELRAAELFGELLSSYPRTTLREAAQVERFRALSRAGQAARAAAEARRYLAEHNDGSARSEARNLALEPKK